ncbi:hypothetical protein SAMN05421788_104382 [Filimonas lacunae]|uniref:Uncharacterized protein n=1 Tax=Filimonas lacunae TaxID=477680 RepID=A0A173MRX9_9BACT|nr:hypothetical protein [Filimonas lacunae]BAV10247.1 hypothetical protein FLA_6308 [Filimonas lacunae]SIT17852.1 hypothetical protein SAMN05421788_104382 [Filimonas lacunae]
MAVSYFQVLYIPAASGFKEFEPNQSADIYKLYILSMGDLFHDLIQDQYHYTVYDFAGDENMLEVIGLTPMNKEFLSPAKMLEDLEYYNRLIIYLEQECKSGKEEALLQELRLWSVDVATLAIMKQEAAALTAVCHYALLHNCSIRFGINNP